jgi:hypothetical protein
VRESPLASRAAGVERVDTLGAAVDPSLEAAGEPSMVRTPPLVSTRSASRIKNVSAFHRPRITLKSMGKK